MNEKLINQVGSYKTIYSIIELMDIEKRMRSLKQELDTLEKKTQNTSHEVKQIVKGLSESDLNYFIKAFNNIMPCGHNDAFDAVSYLETMLALLNKSALCITNHNNKIEE